MESQPLDMEEDDFAKVYRLSYPPFLFTQPLLSAGDGELLRPIIMAIYALGMNATSSNFSLVNLDPMKMDAERSEYTLTASIDGDIQIAHVAWNALLTVSPARICSVIVNPYFHELRDRPLMQVHVKLRSERGPLSARFALYRRRDTSVLFARTQPLVLVDNNGTIMASNVAPITSGPTGEALPDAPAPSDIQRTHEQLIAAARAYTQEQLANLKHECGRILRRTRERDGAQSLEYDNYSLDASTVVSMSAHHVNRGMVTWRLPVGVSLDIMELVTLRSDFASFIIDTMVGIYAHPVLNPLDNEPAMQLVVVFVFIPYGTAPITIIDSTTCLYFSDEEGEAWKIPSDTPATETPQLRQHSSLTPLSSYASSSAPSPAKATKKKEPLTSTPTRSMRERATVRPQKPNIAHKTPASKTVIIRRHMARPSGSAMPVSLKRKRPATVNSTGYLDLIDDEKAAPATPADANNNIEEEEEEDSSMVIDNEDDHDHSSAAQYPHKRDDDDDKKDYGGGGGGGGFSVKSILSSVSHFFS